MLDLHKILIIDYGLGNIGSIYNAIKAIGFDVEVLRSKEDFNYNQSYSGFILPGVGSYPEGMKRLKDKCFDQIITLLIKNQIPGLGICLGMQLLSSWGEEGGSKVPGLDIFEGGVHRLNDKYQPVPHIGWTSTSTELSDEAWHKKLNGVFYYLHSYAISPKHVGDIAAQFIHGDSYYTAAIYRKRLLGVQFHPEKSQENGLELIKEYFMAYL